MSLPVQHSLRSSAERIRQAINSTSECLKDMPQVRVDDKVVKFGKVALLLQTIIEETEEDLPQRIEGLKQHANRDTTNWIKIESLFAKANKNVEDARLTIIQLSTREGPGRQDWPEFDTLARLKNYDGPGLRNEAENLQNPKKPRGEDDYSLALCLAEEIGELLRYFANCLAQYFKTELKKPT